MRYDILIENIKKLSLHDKEELKSLLEKIIIEEKRKEIAKHFKDASNELKAGKLTFSSDINELKNLIASE